MKSARRLLPQDARRIERVEALLWSGKPQHALRELQALTRFAWDHQWIDPLMWRTAQQIELKTRPTGQ